MRSDSNEPKVTHEDVKLLREYVALLERVKELAEYAPTEDDVNALDGYVRDLQASQELPAPEEDTMNDVGNYVSNLKEAQELPTPTEDEMNALAEHVANLKEAAEA